MVNSKRNLRQEVRVLLEYFTRGMYAEYGYYYHQYCAADHTKPSTIETSRIQLGLFSRTSLIVTIFKVLNKPNNKTSKPPINPHTTTIPKINAQTEQYLPTKLITNSTNNSNDKYL